MSLIFIMTSWYGNAFGITGASVASPNHDDVIKWKHFPRYWSFPDITHWAIRHLYHGTRNSIMMTSLNGNIFRVTGPLFGKFTGPGEFPAQRPVTRSFDVFFDLRLNKRLSEQSWGWWFETLSRPSWRHRNAMRQWCVASMIPTLLAGKSWWTESRIVCDLKRHDAHATTL